MQPEPLDPANRPSNRGSRLFLLVIVAIIVLGIAAFVYFRPNPGS
jgi:hypothetical protein